jgi:hypothetical protein
MAALLALPGSPLVIETAAEPNDQITAAELNEKLAKLDEAAGRAGLSDEETKAVLQLAERVQGDEKTLMKLKATGKLSEVEARAVDKLIRRLGNPLEKELGKLGEVAARAGLTDAEHEAARELLIREGFDEKAIVTLFETGKLSPVEKKAAEKIFAVVGHPYAEKLDKLAEMAKQARLTAAEAECLKRGFLRAGCDLREVVKLKQSGSLSEEEVAALKKLEDHFGKLEYHIDNPHEDQVQVVVRLAKVAELTTDLTDALMGLLKRAEFDEHTLLQWQQAGKLTEQEASAVAKLEELLGDLERFVEDPHKEELGELLLAASKANLTLEETKAIKKLAVLVDYDFELAQRLKAAGRLTDLEVKALEKIEKVIDR